MGNCVSLIKRKREPSKAITLAIIGLDDAGKTTLCSVLTGETPDPDIAPTVGFRSVKFSMENFDITMFDLGGGKNIRPIWKNYYSEIYGVLYVVDSTSPKRMKESRDLFRESLEHPLVSGKPVLVISNKVELHGHMEEVDIVNQLDLDRTVNSTNSPSHFVMVSALKGSGKKMDKELDSGMKWLLAKIRSSLSSLDPRLEEDVRNHKEIRDKEKEERRERVRKQREERERVEGLERRRLGLGKKKDSDDEDIGDGGDPFKPLDYDKLKRKDEQLKEEKRRKKENLKNMGDGDKFKIPRSKDDLALGYGRNGSLEMRRSPQSFTRFGMDIDGLDEVDSDMPRFGRSTRPMALPPLEPMVSQSVDSKLLAIENKKKGKKKKKLTDYHMNEDDVVDRRSKNDTIDRLGLSLHEPRSLSRPDADVYDLTPRVSKPKKNNTMTRATKIEEDDYERRNDSYNNSMNLKQYGSARMTEKLNKYGELYPLKSYERDSLQRNGDDVTDSRWKMEREDSMYRRSLKGIAPPNLKHFDDDDDDEDDKNVDEGIEDNSDNISDDDDMGRYTRFSKHKNVSKNSMGSSYDKKNRQKATKKRMDSDDDELEYSVHSTLKDTMRFPRSPPEGESTKDYRKELDDLRSRGSKDYNSKRNREDESRFSRDGNYNHKANRDEPDEYSRGRSSNKGMMGRNNDIYNRKIRSPVDDDDEDSLPPAYSSRSDHQRKKKKNIFKSNRLAPSDNDDDDDDEMEVATPKRFGAPRLVQEHGSRNTSDTDTPSKGRNSRTTHLHSGSRDSDFESKWGLAEDLPAIDNDFGARRLRRPNMDSDGEDVVF